MLHFLWSYYKNCYRKGYTMDVWHYSLLFNLFIIHIMLPFSRSDLNVFALGPDHLRHMQAYVTDAYFISAFGYLGILLGGQVWRLRLGLGLRNFFSALIELPTRGALLLLRSRYLLVIHGCIAIALLAGVLAYYFKADGFGFNLRGFLFAVPALRPIAQFTAFYAVLIASYSLVRFSLYKETSLLWIVLLILFGLIFFGERGNLIAVISMIVIVSFIRLRRRLRLIWLAAGGFATLCIVLLLDALRSPGFSFSAAAGGSILSFFYGNSFSDLRDFALVLSLWDRHYLFGKTYLAGLIAFVPRFLSTFRDTWSLGVVTARIVGFLPTQHPGLRVGIFGEAYLNFGLLGVFLLSLFVGATVRLIDMRMKSSAANLPSVDVRIYSYYVIFLLVAVAENSTTASTFYSILFIFLLSWIMLKISAALKLTNN